MGTESHDQNDQQNDQRDDQQEQQSKDAGDGREESGEAFKTITSQDDLNRVIGDRVKRATAKYADYDDLKSKAKKLDEIESANKTELQKITEERDAHREQSTQAELRIARLEVALEKGLTATQAKRLVGENREELAADADELLTDLGKTSTPRTPKPNPAQGRTDGTTASGDWLRDSLART